MESSVVQPEPYCLGNPRDVLDQKRCLPRSSLASHALDGVARSGLGPKLVPGTLLLTRLSPF